MSNLLGLLGQARAAGYNAHKHVLFTFGNHVLTLNAFNSIRAFTDEQRQAITRLSNKLSKDGPLVQVTVSINR